MASVQALGVDSGAILSPCHVYRYLLWRTWAREKAKLCWIMLNPSTADEELDDATIRVCMGRARHLGFGGIEVVNLFAIRATEPNTLYTAWQPISEPLRPTYNADILLDTARRSAMVICAWGKHGVFLNRGKLVRSALQAEGIRCHALRINKDGSPAHPLRIPYSEPLKEFA